MAATAQLLAAADAAASAAGVPVYVFRGLVERESSWNPYAVSGAGAIGLTQIMPWWVQTEAGRALTGLRSVEDLRDPEKNLQAGARILGAELARFGGNVALALMSYNAGPSAVKKAQAAAGGSTDPLAVEPGLPAETRAYWRAVLTWGAAWAGKISRAQAALQVKAGQITADVLSFAGSSSGRATGLLLLALAFGLVLMGRR
jgi:soluble lytic murein transglycosylase